MRMTIEGWLTLWAMMATGIALVLAWSLGLARRRIEYLEALTTGDWATVDRLMGITDEDKRPETKP